MKLFFYISLAALTVVMSCNGCGERKDTQQPDMSQMQLDLIEQNKKQHQVEVERIAKYVEETKWPMQETKTGLRYWIYEKGTGSAVAKEDLATISYVITLMDGKECYRTSDNKPKQFVVGRDNVESGLHEALMLMHVGDKAKLILPSHLAFGSTGDSGCIPPNASVVYDVHLIRLDV